MRSDDELIPSQDEDWTEEEKQNQGFSADAFQYLSDVLGPRAMAPDSDDPAALTPDDDELRGDPVCLEELRVRIRLLH